MPPTRTVAASAATYSRAMRMAAESLGFSPPSPAEAPEARAAAERLMGHEVAPLQTILDILDIQPASTLVLRQDGAIAGVVATLLLTPAAEPTLKAGAFSGLAPADAFLGRPTDPVALYYLWGLAGSDKAASSAAMELSRRFRYDVLADLTAYAVAATPVGRHVGVTRLGFQPVRRPDDDLLVSPAVARRQAA